MPPAVDHIRRRFPMGYVLSGVGAIIAFALIWTSITAADRARDAAQEQTSILEVAVAKLRNQASAAGLTPTVPPVATLLGGNEVADQGAPTVITFRIGDLALSCSDPTGAGRYDCTTRKLSAPPAQK